MSKQLLLILLLLNLTSLVLGQEKVLPSQNDKKTEEVKNTTDQFTTNKEQQITNLKSTTLSFFSKRRIPDTTNLPKLSTVKTKTYNQALGELKTKEEGFVSDFSVKSAGSRVKDSFTNSSWEFTADGNGNNSDDLQKQALGIFKNDQSVNSFNKLKSQPGDLATPDLKNKAGEVLKDQLGNENEDLNKIKEASEKVLAVEKPSLYGQQPEDLTGTPAVYSEKLKQELKDSLGWEHIEKFSDALSTVAKKDVSQQDFINALNKVAPENNVLNKVDVNNHKLNADNGEKLKGLNDQIENFDLSEVRLPDSLMSELEPLRNYTLPEEYTKLVDSLRDVYLENSNMALDEKTITEETKAVIAKNKKGLFDKFYSEAILGYLKDGKATLFQLSPSAGYHFTDNISLGLGPNLLGRIEGKKVYVTMGFRSFVKAEIFKQRAYLQVEDNVNPVPLKREALWRSPHNILTGGGVLFPISGKLALNACILYRVNNHQTDRSSPWVFRLGLSSIKLK